MTGAVTHARRWRLFAALFAALMLLGACGGDDGDSAEGENGDSATTTEASNDGGSGDNGSGGGGGSGDLSAILSDSDCREFVEAMQGFDGSDFTNPGDLGELAGQFRSAADSAPSEIRDDMRVVAEAFAAFAETLDDLGVDFSDPSSFFNLTEAQNAELEAASQQFDTPEIEAAGERVEAFIEDNCT